MPWSDILQIWPKNWCHCYVSCLVILSIAQAAISENPKETVNVREAGAVKPCFTSIEDTEVQKRAEKFICPEDYFQCNNLKRVPFYVRCDHKPDCLDGSDEEMCVYRQCNNSTEIECGNGQCINQATVCDGFEDCHDKTDESRCDYPECLLGNFTCIMGQCVDIVKHCMNKHDCWDSRRQQNCIHPESCNRYLTQRKGYFATPNYPYPYPAFSKCTYTIATESTTNVIIAFGVVQLTSCDSTHLHVFDHMGERRLDFCGYEIIKPLILQGTTTVVFSTESTITSTGFRATYSLITNPVRSCPDGKFLCNSGVCVSSTAKCDGILDCPDWSDEFGCDQSCNHIFTSLSGIITSPNYPSPYPIHSLCNYTILIDNARYQTTLNFTFYDLREIDDVIQILIAEENGDYQTYKVNTNITSQSKRKIFKFPLLNRVRLRFKSDYLNSGGGFKLIYTTQVPCKKEIMGNGIITSPNYPDNYPIGEFCIYTIKASAKAKYVTLNFTSFRLESISSLYGCTYDYVSMYDGDIEDQDHLIGTFCDIYPVPNMRSTHDTLILAFRSDYTFARPGFHAIIKEHDQNPENCSSVTSINTVACLSGQIINVTSVCDRIKDCDDNSDEQFCNLANCLDGNFTCFMGKCINFHQKCQNPFYCRYNHNSSCNCLYNRYKNVQIFEQDHGIIETSDLSVPNSSWHYIIRVNSGKKILLQFDEYIPYSNLSITTFKFYGNINNLTDSFTFRTLRIPKPFLTTGNFLHIEFISKPRAAYLKLKAKFSAIDVLNKATCNANEYQCSLSGKCVPRDAMCNNIYDCDDWTDELYCQAKNCSKTFEAVKGTIESPNYPSNYWNNLDCTYTIIVNPGYTVEIRLDELDLPRKVAYKHSKDYLTVYKKNSTESLISFFGKLEDLPRKEAVIDYHIMVINFSTDLLYTGKGFKLSFSQGAEQCNKNFTGETGVITSPAYPNRYPSNMDCTYGINLQVRGFYLDFEYISMEPSAICSYDHIEVSHMRRTYKECGNKTNFMEQIPSNSAQISFFSDMFINYFGFLAMYYPDKALPDCPKWDVLEAGNLASPNYPFYYQGIIYCQYTINVQEQELLKLEFNELKLGSFGKLPYGARTCNNGYIIISLLSRPKEFIKLCENSAISPIHVYGQPIKITFRSFNKTVPFLFSIKYIKVKDRLLVKPTSPSGLLISPGFNQGFFICGSIHYEITTSGYSKISLTFNNINISTGSIVVKDGIKKHSKTLDEFHQDSSGATLTSSGPSIMIMYRFATFKKYLGFNATYKSIPATTSCPKYPIYCNDGYCIDQLKFCDGKVDCLDNSDETDCDIIDKFRCNEFFNGSQGVIQSFNYPNTYPSNVECFYGITVPLGNTVTLKFTRFYVHKSAKCQTEFLVIRDGSDRTSPVLHKLCGQKLPPVIRSSSNSILLQFRSRNINRLGETGGFSAFFIESDEYRPCSDNQFTCQNGACIPLNKRCNGYENCLDGSDELLCGNSSCFNSEFRCLSGECVPVETICTSNYTCLDRSHDKLCDAEFFKCRNGSRIPWNLVCNNIKECHDGSDEIHCVTIQCPKHCTCRSTIVKCSYLGFVGIPQINEPRSITKLDLSHNNITQLSVSNFKNMNILGHLDLSFNHLRYIDTIVFSSLQNLYSLNLRYNQIISVNGPPLTALQNLQSLLLDDNVISLFDGEAFSTANNLMNLNLQKQNLTSMVGVSNGLTNLRIMRLDDNQISTISCLDITSAESLQILSLSGNKIDGIPSSCFAGLSNLYSLNLACNKINALTSDSFDGVRQSLRYLYLKSNPLRNISQDAFDGLHLNLLESSSVRVCCLAKTAKRCLPELDAFSSCADLLAHPILRVAIWIVGIIALIGNTYVALWRLKRNINTVNSFLVGQLAIADFLMGVYLIIIASADAYFRDNYSENERNWIRSITCQIAGFLATLSSEVSVYILACITTDRLICIVYPHSKSKITLRLAKIIAACGWILIAIIFAIPLFDIQFFRYFYSKSSVCLPLHIATGQVNDSDRSWLYSIVMITFTNMVGCLYILGAYIAIFIKLHQNKKVFSNKHTNKQDRVVTRNMVLIVGTDLSCWIPIIIMTYLTLANIPIDKTIFAWVAVFVLPLNSAVNPIIYTMSLTIFRKPTIQPHPSIIDVHQQRRRSTLMLFTRSQNSNFIKQIYDSSSTTVTSTRSKKS